MSRSVSVIAGGHGDAEVAEWTGEVLLKEHLQIKAVVEIHRLLKIKHRSVLHAVSAEHLPTAGHL